MMKKLMKSTLASLVATLAIGSSAQAQTAKYALNCTSTDGSLKASVLATPAGNMLTLQNAWVTRLGSIDAAAYELVRECAGVKCPFVTDVSSEMDAASIVVQANDAELGWSDALTLTLGVDGEKVSEVKMSCKHDAVREKLLRAYWTSFKEAHTVGSVGNGDTVRPEDMARVSLDLEKLYQAQVAMTADEVKDPKKEKVALHKNRPFAVEIVAGQFGEDGNFIVDENVGKTETPRLAVGCVFVTTQRAGKVAEDHFRCMFPRFVVNDIRPCRGDGHYNVRLPLFRISTGSRDRVEACPWMRGSRPARTQAPKKPCFTRTRNEGPVGGKK